MPDESAIMRSMREHSKKRMQMAEEAERRSMMAFQSGSFEDYWLGLGREAEERVEAEHERIESEREDGTAEPATEPTTGADPETESEGKAGGSEPSDGTSSDGGDNPSKSATEELPPTA